MLGLRRFAPFSLPPRAIIDQKQIGFLLAQGPFFLYAAAPYESKLSTAHRHTKKISQRCCEILLLVVIRLEFHFLRQFVEKSSVLLSFQKFYKALYINNI